MMGPSREKALHHRQMLLFKPTSSKTGGEQASWPWMAWPRSIQKHSAGLGLYFRTLLYFGAIMLILTALSIIPLISNLRNVNFSKKYELQLVGEAAQPVQEPECPKRFAVGGFVLDLSLGAFCSDSPYSGQFDCPATCIYNTSKLALPLCNDLTLQEPACDTTQPCPSSDVCTEDNPDAQMCCSCCDMVLNQEELNDVPVYQAWVWCTIGTLFWAVWVAFLQKMQADISAEINARHITAADFTVWVSGLRGADASDAPIRSFSEHYGEVISAFHVCNVGTVLNLNNQIEELELRLEEAKQVVNNRGSGHGGFWRWLYRRSIAKLSSMAAQERQLERKLEKLKESFKQAQTQPLKPTGVALVTFNYARHKQNMVIDHDRTVKLADTIFPPGLIRTFHRVTGGLLSRAPRLQVTSKGEVSDRYITVQRAPEPADVWWENATTASNIGFRRLLSWMLYLLLVAVSCGIQGLLTYLSEQERQERVQESRLVKMDSEPSVVETGAIGTAALDELQDSVALRTLSVVQGLSVSILNILVAKLIPLVTDFERNLTSTSAMLSLVLKLSLFYLLNSFIVPIAVVTALPDSEALWYTRGGIVEAAFYIQAINAVLPDLVSVFDVSRMIRYHFFANMAHTQAYMNSAMEPPLFNLPLRFASAVRTVALGVLYAPVLPISPAISVVGLAVSYFADQYLALHVSRKPRAFDVDTLAAVNHLIELLPMAQMLLIFRVYFKGADGIVAPFVVGTVIWSILFLVPLGRFARCARDRDQEEDGTRDVSFDIFRQVGLQATAANHRAGGIGSAYTYNPLADLGPGTSVVAEFYFPGVAERISEAWSKKLSSRIDMRVSGPNTELMQSGRWEQRPRSGGPEATSPPPLLANRIVSLKPAGIQQEAIDDPSFYPQPAFTLDISFGDAQAVPQTAAPPGPTPPAAGPHGSSSAPPYPADERPGGMYIFDVGNPQRLHQPGFYPSPFAPSSLDPNASHAQPSAPPPPPELGVPPTYQKYGQAVQPGGVGSPAHALNPLVAPVPAPSSPALYPSPHDAMGTHVHGLHDHEAAVAPNPSAYLAPQPHVVHQPPLYGVGHVALHPPAHAQPPVPAAPAPDASLYPEPSAYGAHASSGYPNPHAPAPGHDAVPPSYHYDHKPAV